MSTTTLNGHYPCAQSMPCEQADGELVALPGTSYATPVDGLAGCFGPEDGRFDLQRETCPLDNGRQLQISGTPALAIQPAAVLDDGTLVQPTWSATLSGELPYYRAKTGPAATTDCRTEDGYGSVIALAERPLLDDPLPGEDGSYLLCIVAGDSATVSESWQETSEALVVRVDVDSTAPSTPPRVTAVSADGFIVVQPEFDPPELANFMLKAGSPDTVDCTDEQGYFRYRRVPLRLPVAQAPWTLCVIALDAAGNRAAPTTRQITTNQRH